MSEHEGRPLRLACPPEIEAGIARWFAEYINPDGTPESHQRLLTAVGIAAGKVGILEPDDGLQLVLEWIMRHPYQVHVWGCEERTPGWMATVLRRAAWAEVRRLNGDRQRRLPDGTRERVYDEEASRADPELHGSPVRWGSGVHEAPMPNMHAEEAEARAAALAGVSSKDRSLLLAVHVGGWTPEELAAITGVSVAALYKRLQRARARMMDSLGLDIDDDDIAA